MTSHKWDDKLVTTDMNMFCVRFKELIKENGLSYEDLAFLLHEDVKKIKRWLCMEEEPYLKDLIKLAKFFNVKINYLCGIDNKKQR